MQSHRDIILGKNVITVGYRLSYLANFLVGSLYKEVARLTGLARSEFVVLFCLHHLGVLTAQEVCGITGRPKNSISQAVTKLAAHALIEKEAHSSDARRVPLRLTDSGKAMYELLIPLFVEREREMLSVLTDRERDQLEKLLGKLVQRNDSWAG